MPYLSLRTYINNLVWHLVIKMK